MAGSIRPLSLDPNGFSITSMQFNPFPSPSEWVDRLFGSQAHFIPSRHFVHYPDKFEIIKRLNVTPNEFELWSDCSLEFLAYVRLNIDDSIRREYKESKPMLGKGSVTFKTDKERTWNCFYRVLFGHFEDISINLGESPMFAPAAIYCPIPYDGEVSKSGCLAVNAWYRVNPVNDYKISLTLPSNNVWSNSFSGTYPVLYFDFYRSHSCQNKQALCCCYFLT